MDSRRAQRVIRRDRTVHCLTRHACAPKGFPEQNTHRSYCLPAWLSVSPWYSVCALRLFFSAHGSRKPACCLCVNSFHEMKMMMISRHMAICLQPCRSFHLNTEHWTCGTWWCPGWGDTQTWGAVLDSQIKPTLRWLVPYLFLNHLTASHLR